MPVRVYFMQGFSLTSNQLPEIQFGLCNPPTFKITKTFSIDDRKVFTAKVNTNIGDFCQRDEFSATMSDPVVSGK